MYQRIIKNVVKEKIGSGKVIIVVGARQVGKTGSCIMEEFHCS